MLIVGLLSVTVPAPPIVTEPADIKLPPIVIDDEAAIPSILSLYVPFVNCVCFTTVIVLLLFPPIVSVPREVVNKFILPPDDPTAFEPVKIFTVPTVCPDVYAPFKIFILLLDPAPFPI